MTMPTKEIQQAVQLVIQAGVDLGKEVSPAVAKPDAEKVAAIISTYMDAMTALEKTIVEYGDSRVDECRMTEQC